MDVTLGLDISTSVIGWCIIPFNTLTSSSVYPLPVERGHIELNKLTGGFWVKVEYAEKALERIINAINTQNKIVNVVVEDPVKKFRAGASSAHTIMLLARFNVVISRHVRKLLTINPLYIDATAARKAIGVPLLTKKQANGVDQKQQTFEHLCKTVFINVQWPKNRNGKIYPWCLDEIDAYVICLAGCIGLGEPI